MTKTVTVAHIEVPKEWEGVDDYSSHRPMLWLALKNTNGKVVELGCGEGSTPLFKSYCNDAKRVFKSYELYEDWASRMGGQLVSSYLLPLAQIKYNGEENYSLLFIDSAPGEQRKDLVDSYRNSADIIILHDTEIWTQSIYGITEVLNSFKYRLNYYPVGNPGTTALSNTVNVCEWVE